MIKEVTERPTRGQFIEMWIYNGNVWSDVCKWCGNHIKVFDDDTDEFTRDYERLNASDSIFFIKEEVLSWVKMKGSHCSTARYGRYRYVVGEDGHLIVHSDRAFGAAISVRYKYESEAKGQAEKHCTANMR
jgi:hypothetical protein